MLVKNSKSTKEIKEAILNLKQCCYVALCNVFKLLQDSFYSSLVTWAHLRYFLFSNVILYFYMMIIQGVIFAASGF